MLRKLTLAAVVFIAGAQSPRVTPVEAKYVPPQFFAALVFEPARLDKSAKAAGLPVADLWKAIEKFIATDVKQFERVTILADPFPGGNVAFLPAFVLLYPTGTDARNQLAPLLGGEVKKAKVGDISYVRSAKYKLAMVEWAGYAIDDRTILVAAWPTLEAMLEPGGVRDKDRTLAAELAKTEFGHDLTLVSTVPPMMKRYAEAKKRPGAPKDAFDKDLRAALDRLATITISVDLGKDTMIQAEFQCDNAAGARVVHDELKNLLAKAKETYPAALKELEKAIPPELSKPLAALLDETMNNHVLTRDADKLALTIARPKHWEK